MATVPARKSISSGGIYAFSVMNMVCVFHSIYYLPDGDELVPQYLIEPPAAGMKVVADNRYISQKDQLMAWTDGIYIVAKFQKNMCNNSPEDARLIHRSMIETVNSQLEKMEYQRLHACTNVDLAVKVLASLVALAFTNSINYQLEYYLFLNPL